MHGLAKDPSLEKKRPKLEGKTMAYHEDALLLASTPCKAMHMEMYEERRGLGNPSRSLILNTARQRPGTAMVTAVLTNINTKISGHAVTRCYAGPATR